MSEDAVNAALLLSDHFFPPDSYFRRPFLTSKCCSAAASCRLIESNWTFMCGGRLNGTVQFASAKATSSHSGCSPDSFHAPYHTDTLTQRHGSFFFLLSTVPTFSVCLVQIRQPGWVHITDPDCCPATRSVTRWRPW